MQTLGSAIYRLGDSVALTHGGAISGSGEWVEQFQAQINGLQQTKGRTFKELMINDEINCIDETASSKINHNSYHIVKFLFLVTSHLNN